jgi:hypothetical protein
LEAHYRITSEVKAQFKKDTGKDWAWITKTKSK